MRSCSSPARCVCGSGCAKCMRADHSLVVCHKQAGGHAKTLELGVRLVVVDYASPERLAEQLRGIDVVVSAVGGAAFALQEQFAEAAKTAGVKLFVPSEFGNPTKDRTDSLFGVKDAVRLKLKAIGLPYAVFYTGPFSDFVLVP